MKMMKSLLLGSAAGLVAVTGAQAADLPVKAKPVQYVKICTLYGEGFYYIPGTDTCVRFSGYIRADYGYNVNVNVPHYSGVDGTRARHEDRHEYGQRSRVRLQIDTRTQTAYGTLRTYGSINFTNTTWDGNEISLPRAFIQWAGFTFGRTKSLADVPGQMGDAGMRAIHQLQTESTTGASGINTVAYSWQLGNGAMLSIGADERRVRNLFNASDGFVELGAFPDNYRAGQSAPSPFASLYVRQAWGEAGVAFIAQQNRAVYYESGCIQPGTTLCGHPDDDWGWGVRAGAEFKLPMLGPGDRLGISAYYSQGAVRLTAQNLLSPSLFKNNSQLALGSVVDGSFIDGGQIEQTTAWSINAGYEHFWTRNFSTTVYGGYVEISYPDSVVNGFGGTGWFCANADVVPIAGQACDPGFSLWHIGTHSDWFPVRGLRLAVDVMYTHVNTAMKGLVFVDATPEGVRPTGIYEAKDLGIVSVMFRAQRNY